MEPSERQLGVACRGKLITRLHMFCMQGYGMENTSLKRDMKQAIEEK